MEVCFTDSPLGLFNADTVRVVVIVVPVDMVESDAARNTSC